MEMNEKKKKDGYVCPECKITNVRMIRVIAASGTYDDLEEKEFEW